MNDENMKLGKDLLEKKFDDIDEKIGLLIERYQGLQAENAGLKTRIEELENQLENTYDLEEKYSQQEAVVESKINGLLEKLNQFSAG